MPYCNVTVDLLTYLLYALFTVRRTLKSGLDEEELKAINSSYS